METTQVVAALVGAIVVLAQIILFLVKRKQNNSNGTQVQAKSKDNQEDTKVLSQYLVQQQAQQQTSMDKVIERMFESQDDMLKKNFETQEETLKVLVEVTRNMQDMKRELSEFRVRHEEVCNKINRIEVRLDTWTERWKR